MGMCPAVPPAPLWLGLQGIPGGQGPGLPPPTLSPASLTPEPGVAGPGCGRAVALAPAKFWGHASPPPCTGLGCFSWASPQEAAVFTLPRPSFYSPGVCLGGENPHACTHSHAI